MLDTVPLPLVSALLDLERAVGKLSQAMRDPRRRERLWADAARREAVAAARLDGVDIDATDFLVSTVAPELVAPARRATGIAAHALWCGVRLAQGKGRAPAPPPPFELTAPPAPKRLTLPLGAASDAWRAVEDMEAEDEVSAPSGLPQHPPAPPPWTVAWLERLWAATEEGASGREGHAFPPHEERQAGALLDRLDGFLKDPGLVGGIEALGYLLRPAPVARVAPWAVPLARIMAPPMLARACRAPEVWLPPSPALLAERTGARLAAGGPDLDWRIWLAATLAEAALAERRRAEELDSLAEGWRDRTGNRRRNSKLPDVLDGLFEHPAFTVRRLQRRLAITFRGAQLIVDELVEAGVVREVTHRALDRVYVATDLL